MSNERRCTTRPGGDRWTRGGIPGLPRVNLHNKVLSPTVGGEEYMKPFREAAAGTLGLPDVLVIDGSIPNENINGDGACTAPE